MLKLNRRAALTAAAAVAAACSLPAQAAKEMPRVPTDWDPDTLYKDLQEKGLGVSFAGPAGRPKALVCIDPQCQWCVKLIKDALPLKDKIDFVWYPCAELNIHSEPQGATILAAENPEKKLLEHEDLYSSKEFKGIKYDLAKIPVKFRDAVWINSKIFRRTACRVIPFGVMRDKEGKYHAIYSGMKTEDLAALCGRKA